MAELAAGTLKCSKFVETRFVLMLECQAVISTTAENFPLGMATSTLLNCYKYQYQYTKYTTRLPNSRYILTVSFNNIHKIINGNFCMKR